MHDRYNRLIARVADLEADGLRGALGRGVGLPSSGTNSSVVESKAVLNLAELTDDKSKLRQRNVELMNALTHLDRGYGCAMERINECLDKGSDPG